jgi:hypothetical protein
MGKAASMRNWNVCSIHSLNTIDNFVRRYQCKIARNGIFASIIRNESLRDVNINNGVRAVNFATPKTLTVKCTMSPRRNIHNSTSPEGKTNNKIVHILIERRRHSSALDAR